MKIIFLLLLITLFFGYNGLCAMLNHDQGQSAQSQVALASLRSRRQATTLRVHDSDATPWDYREDMLEAQYAQDTLEARLASDTSTYQQLLDAELAKFFAEDQAAREKENSTCSNVHDADIER